MMMMAISPETAIRQFEGDAVKRRIGVLVLMMVSVEVLISSFDQLKFVVFFVEINCENVHKNIIWKM